MMVARAVSFARTSLVSIMLGVLVGLGTVIAWPDISDGVLDVFDRMFPVAVGSGNVLEIKGDEVVISTKFHKLRDCERLTMEAYSRMPDRSLLRAQWEREGAKGELGHLRKGDAAQVTFRIWPVRGAKGVELYMQYKCGDSRIVWTRILEVAL